MTVLKKNEQLVYDKNHDVRFLFRTADTGRTISVEDAAKALTCFVEERKASFGKEVFVLPRDVQLLLHADGRVEPLNLPTPQELKKSRRLRKLKAKTFINVLKKKL
jgi:hypothetical protein